MHLSNHKQHSKHSFHFKCRCYSASVPRIGGNHFGKWPLKPTANVMEIEVNVMLIALVFSGILVATPAENAGAPAACSDVAAMKSRIPNVAHAALLYFGNSYAGVLYGGSNGAIWYQSKLAQNAADDASRKRATTMLGISNDVSSASPVAAPKPNVADMLAPDVQLKGCF